MLNNKKKEIKNKLTNSQYKLAISIFNEDIEFHNRFSEKTEEELCEVLVQAANLAIRF